MTNPYKSPAEQTPAAPPPIELIRNVFAAIAFFGGLCIAASAIDRFQFYGGFKSLASMSAVAQGSAALWAFTHLLGILTAFCVCVGLVRKNIQMVLLGSAGFLAICTFAWAWPMDFLWFG
jgi:hypothetical protein